MLPINVMILVVLVGMPALTIAGWIRWVRQRRQLRARQPRLSLAGLILGSASGLLALAGLAYVRFVQQFPFCDPTLLTMYRCGFSLSVAGLVFSLISLRRPHPTRWYDLAASMGTLLFWLIAAAAE